MPKLVIKNGQFVGLEFKFEGDVVIGRGSMSDVVIDDPTISRRHAIVAKSADGYVLNDLQSGNGSKVNGMRIHEPTDIYDGDEIRLGNVMIQLLDGPPAPGPQTGEHSIVNLTEGTDEGGAAEVLQVMDAADPAASLLATFQESKEEDHFQELLAMSRRLQLIYDIGEVVASTLDEEQLLSQIMGKLFDVFPQADRGFIMQYDTESQQLTPKVTRTRTGETAEITVSRTLVKDVIDNRRGVLSANAMGDDRFSMGQSILQYEIRSVICVPMIAKDEIVGVIHVDASDPRQPFQKDDMALLLGIAGQAALAIANARLHQRVLKQELLEQDLILANRIQANFLPQKPPDVEGFEFKDEYNAALEVGGDYYDFFDLPDDHIGIVVGDVSGKGVSAALYMAKLSSDVRFFAAGQTEPQEILFKLNSALSEDVEEGMFVTLILLTLNTRTRELKFSNAGHLPPMILRAGEEVIMLGKTGNIPLGISDDAAFDQETFLLEEGDVVAVFTDGVFEAMNPEDEQFGFDRIEQAMLKSDGTPGGMLDSIMKDVHEFFRGAPQNDDITLVCFGPSLAEFEMDAG